MAELGETALTLWKQGAEARLYKSMFYGKPCVIKERFLKAYRHPKLDATLTDQRTRSEVRSIMRCKLNGIPTPNLYLVDMENHRIHMEYLTDCCTVKDHINDLISPKTVQLADGQQLLVNLGLEIGRLVASMHAAGIIHGDLTTSNMLIRKPYDSSTPSLVLIDFGLGYMSDTSAEDKAVDLYVLERALLSSHPNTEDLFAKILSNYQAVYSGKKELKEIISKYEDVRARGRKRTMVG